MLLNLYPEIIHDGDLSPDAVGSEIDERCEEIHAACKGFGTDEDRLLQAMGSQDAETRCKTSLRYKELYDKDLVKVVKSECGQRAFGQTLMYLAVDPVTAECMMIEKACKGLGTDELLLFTLICGRTNAEMEILKKKYFDINTEDLGRKLDSELGGSLEKLIFNCLQGIQEEYDPEYHTEDDKMKELCEEIHKAGQGSWGTDETGLFKSLCAMPPEYIKPMNLCYAEMYGYTLTKAMEEELSGAVSDAAVFMLNMKLKPYETIAKMIQRACKGFGTNERLLTTLLIRYQPVMAQVNEAHVEEYGQTIMDRIKSETGGDYHKVLIEIMKVGGAGEE